MANYIYLGGHIGKLLLSQRYSGEFHLYFWGIVFLKHILSFFVGGKGEDSLSLYDLSCWWDIKHRP